MRIYTLHPTLSSNASIRTELSRTLKPHNSPVVTTSVDGTGTLLATGAADGTVKVWDIRGGFATHSYHGHGGVVSALKFFEVTITGQAVERSKSRDRKGRRNNSLDGRGNGAQDQQEVVVGYRLASGGEDGKIRIWDLHKQQKAAATLDSHVSVVRSLDYSSEENALVSGSRDKTIMVWDARTWKIRSTIPILEGCESAGFLKKGTVVFTGGENGRVRLWSLSGKEITKEQAPGAETESITGIIHYPDLPFLFSIHADQTFIFHSLEPLADASFTSTIDPLPILRRVYGTHDEIIDVAYVGPDSSLLALATNIEDIRIISLRNPTLETISQDRVGDYFSSDVASLKGHEDIIITMSVDWSGHWLATGAKDNTARLWKLDPANNSFSCYAAFTGHAESLGAASLPPTIPAAGTPARTSPLDHPPSFLITGSQDKTIKRWDIPRSRPVKGKSLRAAYTRKAHDKDINAIDINHDSTLFASASQDRTVKIWSTETGETVGILRGHRRGVWAVKFSPKGTPAPPGTAAVTRGLVATGGGDRTVRIWSLADYSCLLTFEGHTNSVLKVLWLLPPTDDARGRSKCGAQVASAGGDGLVKVWDVGSGEVACTLDNHTDRVWALATPCGPPPATPKSADTDATEAMDDDGSAAGGKTEGVPNWHRLVSGGADGVLTFWADTTALTLSIAAERQTRQVELTQRLDNLVHVGNMREAIVLALQLDQPHRLLKLFTSVAEGEGGDEQGGEQSWTGSRAVDDALGALADSQLWLLLVRLRDWNTNARTASVAQRVLTKILRTYPAERLASLKPPRKAESVDADPAVGGGVSIGGLKARRNIKELLEGLKVYTERHYRRVEELCDESYLLEFTLREMDEVVGDLVDGPGGSAGGRADKDVVMAG